MVADREGGGYQARVAAHDTPRNDRKRVGPVVRESLAAVRDHNRRLSVYVLDLNGALADNAGGSM